MSLEIQIRNLLQQAPLQYGHRTRELLGLFGTPANGFIWQDGELVPAEMSPPAPEDTDRLADVDVHATYDLDASARSLHVYGQFTQAMQRARRARFVRDNIDRLVQRAPVPAMVPPEFIDGRIGDIPDDIRDDWLLGALEFLLLILRMDPAFTTRAQKNSDQIQAASTLLQTLLLRFAHRVAFTPYPGTTAPAAASDEMPEPADA